MNSVIRTGRIAGLFLAAGILMMPGCSRKPDAVPRAGLSGKVTISGAWALYPMVVKWTEEFKKANPGVVIDVSAGGAGKGMADALSQAVDLGMISREINPVEVSKGAWWVSVVKDAVVPTINSENPVVDAVLKRGVTSNEFTEIFVTGKMLRWDLLVSGSSGEIQIRPYTRSDACGAAETWGKYLGGNQQDLKGVGVYGDPGLAEAVRKDKLGTGYNNINFVYDAKTKLPVQGLRIIPIDINGNGKVDKEEDFYANVDEIVKAIADGRYPSPPARALHLVSFGYPKSKAVVEFLKWVLTDGQKYVPEAGYINLPREQLAEELNKLGAAK